MSSMISIKDQMPPKHRDLLFLCANGEVYHGRMCYGLHAPWFCIHASVGHGTVLADHNVEVTHWMPLDEALARLTGAPAEPRPLRIKCTDDLGNVTYVYTSDGQNWRCALANGIPAGFSYAVGNCDEMGLRFQLADAKSPSQVLQILGKAGGSRRKFEVV